MRLLISPAGKSIPCGRLPKHFLFCFVLCKEPNKHYLLFSREVRKGVVGSQRNRLCHFRSPYYSCQFNAYMQGIAIIFTPLTSLIPLLYH